MKGNGFAAARCSAGNKTVVALTRVQYSCDLLAERPGQKE
jgi:hypothetical protein